MIDMNFTSVNNTILERQAETIRFLRRQLSEQKLLEMALRRRIAYLLKLILEMYGELKEYLKIDTGLIDLLSVEFESYRDYFPEKDNRVFGEKIALKFLPFIIQYLLESCKVLKYNEFINWLRKNHPRILQHYSVETITRSIRYLVEKQYLKRIRKGEFILAKKSIEKIKSLQV